MGAGFRFEIHRTNHVLISIYECDQTIETKKLILWEQFLDFEGN